jgi:hypothetical protein
MSSLTYQAFLSYASADRAVVRRLHRALEQTLAAVTAGSAKVFLDEADIRGGELEGELGAALAASQCLVVCCSPAAQDSIWVAKEIDRFRALEPEREVFAVLLAGTPETAVPAALKGVEEVRYHDLREGWLLGMLKPRSRDELLRLAAKLTGKPLRELIDWNRRRLLRQAAVGATVAAGTGAAGWQAYRLATALTPADFGAVVDLSWTEDEGLGQGVSIASVFSVSPLLAVRAKLPAAGERAALSQPVWETQGQFRLKDETVALQSDTAVASLIPSPSTAGNWFRSRRVYTGFRGTIAGALSASAIAGLAFEARLSGIGLPMDLTKLGQPDTAEDRARADKRFGELYGITSEQRDQWMDYSARGLPIRAEIALLVRGVQIWRSEALAARLWEHDEDVRGLHVCYFPPLGRRSG